MTPEIFDIYQRLETTVGDHLPQGWAAFLLKARFGDMGLVLQLRFTDCNGRTLQFTPVPSQVFDILEDLREAMMPQWEWVGMTFAFEKPKGYEVHYDYADAKPAASSVGYK